MKSRKHHVLYNELHSPPMNTEEYERLRSDFLGEETRGTNYSKLPSFIRLGGIVLLAVAALFVLQQWYFASVGGLSLIVPAMLRAASFLGTAILVLIGLSLLVRHQSDRSSQTNRTAKPVHASVKEKAPADTPQYHTQYGSDPSSMHHMRWFRSVTDKKLFGVCGGLAAYYNVDPTIVRILFVIAFFNYGFSLAIYVILAAVLPKKPVLPIP